MTLEPTNVIQLDFTKSKNKKNTETEKSVGKANARKLEIFGEMLQHGVVMLVLDARLADVVVPSDLKEEPDLRLNFSHRFGRAGFCYDIHHVEATLSFPGGLFHCEVPWESVFGMISQQTQKSMMWPEDAPTGLKYLLKQEPSEERKNKLVDHKNEEIKPKSPLRLVKDE